MKCNQSWIVGVVVALSITAEWTLAQPSNPAAPPLPPPIPATPTKPVETPPPEPELPSESSLRDPTTPSPRMREILNAKVGTTATKITPVLLRGRVISRGKPAMALLEVDGKLHTVARGAVIYGTNNTLYRVVVIDSALVQVAIEAGAIKETVDLR